MAIVKYPHRVICKGLLYPAGAEIEVENAAEHVAQGAVEVRSSAASAKPATAPKRSTKKQG